MKCSQEATTASATLRSEPGAPHTISTDGIDVYDWTVKLKLFSTDEMVNAAFTLWDFAGQSIYYTTHQFFLSSRALYLIVLDQTQSDEVSKVEFWLEVGGYFHNGYLLSLSLYASQSKRGSQESRW